MKQRAEIRPIPSLQRQAAIAFGGATDHAGSVRIGPIAGFDLNRTIFNTLEGAAARFVMRTRIAKQVYWQEETALRVQQAYDSTSASNPLPAIDEALMRFMVEECDFDVEHADGSFLDHLYFCFEYSFQHYPQHSPLVMLLHSILGTGTNTFAMGADKIPALQPLMSKVEWQHVQAFPSILRLLYGQELRHELRNNLNRADKLESVRFHRVIDNEEISLSGDEFWVHLNYQLIHLIDFLPVANWSVQANDTSFILFRSLHEILERNGRLGIQLKYEPASKRKSLLPGGTGEDLSLPGWLTTLIPVDASERSAASSIQRFSARIGHSLAYELQWSS